MRKKLLCSSIALIIVMNTAMAQSITLPPSGDNQKCAVTQWIGLVSVTITYNSPDVTGPDGQDRKGKIWGGVVPYGWADNNFGTAKKIPWRAGANENTSITFSHDVKIEGEALAAGTYGLHMVPGREKWTLIFSNDSEAWGSYFYNENEDALRVEVVPQKHTHTEWLSYNFIEKRPTYTVAALQWEEISIPFKIEADVISLYLEQIRNELKGSKGLEWQNWIAGVNFCISNNVNLEEASLWSQYAISAPIVGEKNFTTLSTKVNLLYKLDRIDAAEKLLSEAILLPTATVEKIDSFGHGLIEQGLLKEAMKVFELNMEKHPDENFITYIGLARGYEALGKTRQAIKQYRLAAEYSSGAQKDYCLTLARNLEL